LSKYTENREKQKAGWSSSSTRVFRVFHGQVVWMWMRNWSSVAA